MNKNKMRKALALLSAVLLSFSFAGCDFDGGNANGPVGTMTAKTELTTVKVALETDISSLSNQGMKISGAKGETDSAQFVVNCDEDVTSYDVTISDFTMGGNVIAKENVEICKQLYSYCNEGGFHGTLGTGYFPDALIPIEYIKNAGEDTIKKNTNQGFWLNVEIPADAAAGVYTATVTMEYNKTGKITLPVTLEVYDFELGTPEFKSCFLIWQGWLSYGELTNSNEKYMDYYDKMLDYNMFAYTFPADTPEMFVSYVREYYSKVASFGIPYSAISNTENNWPWAYERVSALLDACLEDGVNYFDKAYYYWDLYYDEYTMVPWREPCVRPTIEGCDQMEETIVADYVTAGKLTEDSEIATSLKGLRHAITAGWDEQFSDLFNMCTPGFPHAYYTSDHEYMQGLRESNDVEWWTYGCVGTDKYPCPGWEINEYTVSTRDLMWQDYETDILGTLYWCVNGYCNWSTYTSWGYEKINDLYTTASHEGVTSGDGYLMYPGAPYGSDTPFASIRMASYRDGVDDHTYMTQLRDLYEGLSEKFAVSETMNSKNLVSFMNEQLLGRNASKFNYQGVLDAKDTLAKAIVMAGKNGLAIEDIKVNGNNIEYSIYANSDVTLSLNGQALTGVASGEGKHYEGTVAIPADRALKLSVSGEGGSDTLQLTTAPEQQLISGFETAEDISDFVMLSYNQDKKELNTNSAYAKDGNSVMVTLNGRSGSETINKSYEPRVAFDIAAKNLNLNNLWSIEFEVCNTSDKDVEFILFVEGEKSGVTITTDYDKFILRAGEWRKITLDNTKLISMKSSMLDIYTSIGIRCGNLLDTTGIIPCPYSISLSFDNFAIRNK